MGRKIELFVNGEYVCTTNRAKTCKEAVSNFLKKPQVMGINGMKQVDLIGRRVSAKFKK